MNKEKYSNFFDNHYKKLLIIPLVLIAICLVYLVFFYVQHGDIIYKDVSLTGGTTITITSNLSIAELQSKLITEFPNIAINIISDNFGNQIHLIITVPEEPEKIKPALELVLGYQLTDQNSSIEFTGSSLSQDFYSQLIRAVIFAFLLMALVVFLVFGEAKLPKIYCFLLTLICAKLTFPKSGFLNFLEIAGAIILFIYGLYLSKDKKSRLYSCLIFFAFITIYIFPYYYLIIPLAILLFFIYSKKSLPSIYVILSAFADIIMPLAIINLMGMKLSSAGIVAFLMLIGYSVDTDILLTTRVLNRKANSINSAIYGAFKTGITMTLTSIVAIAIGLIVVYGFQSILNQIFTILIIGLAFDLLNTWVTNVCLIKLYVENSKR